MRKKEDWLRQFEDLLLAEGKTEETVKKYLRVAESFLDAHPGEEPFEKRHVQGYLANLRRRGLREGAVRWTYYVLRTFFRALDRPWPKGLKPPRAEEPEVPVLSLEEMRRLEEAARRRGPRDYALIRLENVVGLRRVEIRNLNISDYQKPYLRVVTAKGGNVVWRLLDPETCRALDEWIRVRRRKRRQADPEALFIRGTHGPRLSLRGLSHIFKQIREEAGIKAPGAGFHAVRRGRVTMLHERGMTGPELTKEWGWKSNSTVQTYIRLSKAKVERKLMEIDPFFHQEEVKY